MTNRINILGCPVDNLSREETVGLIDGMIASRRPHQHVVVNVDKVLKARKDKDLLNIISGCDIINADGMPIVWTSKLLGRPLKERVAGIDLMEDLMENASCKGHRVFFLGARPEVVKKTVDIYKARYNDLRIAGFRHGYWKDDEEKEVAESIKTAGADILLMAVSSPKKEVFLNRYLNTMNVPFVMGVGGSFDVVSGRKKRAPVWMQTTGFEWLYRFIQEPRRMWKRYLVGNTVFVWLVLREFIRVRVLGLKDKG